MTRRPSDAEVAEADAAVEDVRAHGAAARRCLRCDRPLVVDDRGPSYVVRCETDGCFRLTARGI